MSAADRALALSAALADELKTQLPALAARIKRAFVLPRELKQLSLITIAVTPISWEMAPHARAIDRHEIEIEIGFVQALTGTDADLDAAIATFLATVASVADLWQLDESDQSENALRTMRLAGCQWSKFAQPTILDADALAERIAASALTVTYTHQTSEA